METVVTPFEDTTASGGGDDSDVEDDYSHESVHLVYTVSNVPGVGANSDMFETQYVGCECDRNLPCGDECSCVVKSGGRNYDELGSVVDSKLGPGSLPVFECNAHCRCSKQKCGNRIVQKGPRKNLAVFGTEEKGKGLKTLEEIEKGTFVCQYAGEIIGLEEAMRRTAKQAGMNYIYTVKEYYGKDERVLTIIDPTVVGNVGRYVNHSCDPNLFPVLVRQNNPVPSLSLFARRNVLPGEELTFDYGGGEETPSDEISGVVLRPCKCGSLKCRKYLPFDRSLF